MESDPTIVYMVMPAGGMHKTADLGSSSMLGRADRSSREKQN